MGSKNIRERERNGHDDGQLVGKEMDFGILIKALEGAWVAMHVRVWG